PNPSNLSPSDRLLARRRRIFVRDWGLVLIALGLAIVAGVVRGDRVQPQDAPAAIAAEQATDAAAAPR
ncbi:MAG TPA: hypothetical protein VGN89_07770, partial [Phenylobacterium sp.]|nr:hypothetical protein [Phenylobacterium sp.]